MKIRVLKLLHHREAWQASFLKVLPRAFLTPTNDAHKDNR